MKGRNIGSSKYIFAQEDSDQDGEVRSIRISNEALKQGIGAIGCFERVQEVFCLAPTVGLRRQERFQEFVSDHDSTVGVHGI